MNDEQVKCNPTMKNAILSKCHDCMGHYFDGKKDCRNPECSLYAWMPYRKSCPSAAWQMYYSRSVGLKLRQPPTASQILNGKKLAEKYKQTVKEQGE